MTESENQRRGESHADRHDREKLDRWRQGLDDSQPDPFPVCAVFLVSESDQAAHDTFRKFRDSFESRNSGFHNLVIFGQHGVSTTVKGLLAELDLPSDELPWLVIAGGAEAEQVTVLPLPPGDGTQDPMPEDLLGHLESEIDRGTGASGLEYLTVGKVRKLGGSKLNQVAGELLGRI